ncbi:MAG: glycerophosphodiester phosphodiesterase family protein [Marinomonas sp.]
MLNTKTLNFSRKNADVFTISHRGVWAHAPENSLKALEAAISLGAEIVEIDTQRCLSGEFIVIHDSRLDRTTTGKGDVSQSSLEYIQSLYLLESDGSTKKATEDRVPLLSEALELARNRIIINVDAKRPDELLDIVHYIEELGLQDQVIIKSTVQSEVTKDVIDIAQRVMHIPIVYAAKGNLLQCIEMLEPLAPKMIELFFEDFEEFLSVQPLLDKLDYRIWLNTLDQVNVLGYCDHQALRNPALIWGELIRAKVGALQTDQTLFLRNFLAEKNSSI